MKLVAVTLMFEHARICLAEEVGIEALAETFGGLSHFFFYFIIDFGYLVLDEHIGAIAFL